MYTLLATQWLPFSCFSRPRRETFSCLSFFSLFGFDRDCVHFVSFASSRLLFSVLPSYVIGVCVFILIWFSVWHFNFGLFPLFISWSFFFFPFIPSTSSLVISFRHFTAIRCVVCVCVCAGCWISITTFSLNTSYLLCWLLYHYTSVTNTFRIDGARYIEVLRHCFVCLFVRWYRCSFAHHIRTYFHVPYIIRQRTRVNPRIGRNVHHVLNCNELWFCVTHFTEMS